MRRPCMGWYTACPGFLFAACMTGVLLGRGLLVSWSGLGKDVLTGQFLREKAAAAAAGTFGPFFIAVISGSGDAAAFAFNGAITPFAEQFGLSIMDLGSLAQIAGAMGRSMSPIAGAAIICAGLAKVNPIEVSKRNALPCLASAIVLMLLL